MQNFEKPLKDFTEEELHQKTDQWDPRFGALALYELQRRQQVKNTKQVETLIKETKFLKKITDKNAKTAFENARSDNYLARVAIIIAVCSAVVQIAFSIHHDVECRFVHRDYGLNTVHYSDCRRIIDLGIFGTHYFNVNNFSGPMGTSDS